MKNTDTTHRYTSFRQQSPNTCFASRRQICYRQIKCRGYSLRPQNAPEPKPSTAPKHCTRAQAKHCTNGSQSVRFRVGGAPVKPVKHLATLPLPSLLPRCEVCCQDATHRVFELVAQSIVAMFLRLPHTPNNKHRRNTRIDQQMHEKHRRGPD